MDKPDGLYRVYENNTFIGLRNSRKKFIKKGCSYLKLKGGIVMTLFSMMLVAFAVLFWIFRVGVALTASLNLEFFLEPLNLDIEIALAFVTLFCLIFICRRNIIAALIYLLSHIGYFGVFAYNEITRMLTGDYIVSMNNYINLIFSIAGIILPFLVFLDIGLSNNDKKSTRLTKKTDWYYQGTQYDREYDERADRNQYKF